MKKTTSTKIQLALAIDAKLLWDVLTQSRYTQVYMFNCTVESNWLVDSPIIWQGNYQGYQAFQKGKIIAIKPFELLKYSTFDPNIGLSDIADNYIYVTYAIKESVEGSYLTITNETFDGNEERMQHIMQGWQTVTEQIKKIVDDF